MIRKFLSSLLEAQTASFRSDTQQLICEALESRQMLSVVGIENVAGEITVTGTSDADVIQLFENADAAGFQVRINGDPSLTETFQYADVTGITVNALAGDDNVISNLSIGAAIFGQAGDDFLIGGSANDLLQGDNGNDRLVGRGGDDDLRGNAGDDRLFGQAGDDQLFAGVGADTVVGGVGVDQIFAFAGNNTLNGNSGDDIIIGAAGIDVIDGGSGDDQIEGGAGNDTIFAGIGDDTVDGGIGDDIIRGDAGADTIFGSNGDDILSGQTGDDRIFGQAGNDTIVGNTGNDRLNGQAGDDRITAGLGDDIVVGGNGADTIFGTAGVNSLDGNLDDDTIVGGTGVDTIDGGGGNDQLSGGADRDILRGGLGADVISGDAGDDTISGDGGNDTISGGTGTDTLSGDAGNDQVSGDEDNDFLLGGLGNDTILGGSGADTFFATGDEFDHQITQSGNSFQVNDLSDPDLATLPSGNNLLTSTEVIFFFEGSVLQIEDAVTALPPIVARVVVQPIVVANSDGSGVATSFGNAAQEAEIQARVGRIYRQAGVEVQFLDTVQYNNTFANGSDDVDRPISDFSQIIFQGDIAGVGSSDPRVVDLYFVERVPDQVNASFSAGGRGFVGQSGVVIDVADTTPDFAFGRQRIADLIGHEIGHNFGLDHTPDEQTLLTPGIPTAPRACTSAAGRLIQVGRIVFTFCPSLCPSLPTAWPTQRPVYRTPICPQVIRRSWARELTCSAMLLGALPSR